jgi:hypothetical protein
MMIATSSNYKFAVLATKHDGGIYTGITFWSCNCVKRSEHCVDELRQLIADLRERLPGVPMLVDEEADKLLSKFGKRA